MSTSQLPESLLVVNRGEIARRIIRTARELGVRTLTVHAAEDAELPFVSEADESFCIEAPTPAQAYLAADQILQVAAAARVEAVHPGYGFLSENPDFARAVVASGRTWVGPDPETIFAMGDKIEARKLMASAGVSVGAGSGQPLELIDVALEEAAEVGYPVMVKASAGGGGIGMGIAHAPDQLRTVFETTRARSERSFGSSRVFIERYIPTARHVEVQILGLPDGEICVLGERDCSVQRRHQKIAEETPAPRLSDDLRTKLQRAAQHAGEAVQYRNAGTVEFLVDATSGDFVFLEINTRIQVEHPVTELVTGIDLVEQQLRIAVGAAPSFHTNAISPHGHAIEFRIYAESPITFLPAPGKIEIWDEPSGEGVRVDSGYRAGNVVTPYFDPLLAKLCTWGESREVALERMKVALDDFVVTGPLTNIPFLRRLCETEEFTQGRYDTTLVAEMQRRAKT